MLPVLSLRPFYGQRPWLLGQSLFSTNTDLTWTSAPNPTDGARDFLVKIEGCSQPLPQSAAAHQMKRSKSPIEIQVQGSS